MGLALCSSIPRDIVVQIAILLLFVTLVLQAAVIGLNTSDNAGGYFTLAGTGSSEAFALVLIAAHPAIYIPPGSVLASGSAGTSQSKLCDPSASTLSYSCARFAESFHVVNGTTLTSFITFVVTFILSVFVLARFTHTTGGLLCKLTTCASVPAALQCASIGVFFVHVVYHARRDTARAGGFSLDQLHFHRGLAANLMVAATAFAGSSVLLLAARWASVVYVRSAFESQKVHTDADVKKVTVLHMVNDDWLRQKQILMSHAHSVKVEMAVKQPPSGDRQPAQAEANEPFRSRQADRSLLSGRRFEMGSDDSGEHTLHFCVPTDLAGAKPGGGARPAPSASSSPPSRGIPSPTLPQLFPTNHERPIWEPNGE